MQTMQFVTKMLDPEPSFPSQIEDARFLKRVDFQRWRTVRTTAFLAQSGFTVRLEVSDRWAPARANELSNSVFDDYDTIVDRCCVAWKRLVDMPDRIRSLATRSWAKPSTA